LASAAILIVIAVIIRARCVTRENAMNDDEYEYEDEPEAETSHAAYHRLQFGQMDRARGTQ